MSRPLPQSYPEPARRPGQAPATVASARAARSTVPPRSTTRTARVPSSPPTPVAAASSPAPADVTAFLDHYGTAFAAADLITVSRCYVPPVLVVSSGSAITFRSHDEIVEGFRDVVLGHREWGLASLRHEVLDLDALTGDLLEATVRWTYHAARNRARFSDRYRYLLRIERGQGPRIQSVVVLDGGVADDA